MKASEEEREHAMKFMDYLNKRGGLLQLKQIHVCISSAPAMDQT